MEVPMPKRRESVTTRKGEILASYPVLMLGDSSEVLRITVIIIIEYGSRDGAKKMVANTNICQARALELTLIKVSIEVSNMHGNAYRRKIYDQK